MTGYYIHTHGNDGYLWLQSQDGREWQYWSVQYPLDVLSDLQQLATWQVNVTQLPEQLRETIGFRHIHDSIREVYQLHDDVVELSAPEQQLLGLALFMAAMRMGPTVFTAVESIARKCRVVKPLTLYSKDWDAYAQTVWDADALGKSLFQNPDTPEMPH